MVLNAQYLRAMFVVKALAERRWSRIGPLPFREMHIERARIWVAAARMVRRMFKEEKT